MRLAMKNFDITVSLRIGIIESAWATSSWIAHPTGI